MTDIDRLLADAASAASPDSKLPAEQVAGIALQLSAVWARVDASLEPLKERLRDIAAEGQQNPTVFDGFDAEGTPLGTVQVNFPEKQVKLAKGVDIEKLKERLGSDFDRYFETSISYRPRKDLPRLLRTSAEGSPDVSTIVLDAVEYAEPTPRVGFKPTVGG